MIDGFLHADGKKILDGSGRKILLKGWRQEKKFVSASPKQKRAKVRIETGNSVLL